MTGRRILPCRRAEPAPRIYPAQYGEVAWIEFDSMIDLRPSQGNRTRSVEGPEIQRRIIIEVVGQLVRADD